MDPIRPGRRDALDLRAEPAEITRENRRGNDGFALGHGGFPLIGTPDQVAAGIISLHEAGFAGTTLSFVDYLREFPYFAEEVLPRLSKAGIR
jgi:alkanesulfonate monooxygenase SsuD/methylene tetrahydromethanopterin reductase-like flavin-dependent oxidoreductase (luciferase family)